MGWARHVPPSLRLLGAELEERSLLEGSELVVLVFACCFSCSCSCAAIFLLLSFPLQEQIRISFLPRTTPARTPPPPREKSNLCARQGTGDKGGGEEKQMQIGRDRGREKRGEERERVCVRDGNGRTGEVGGERNGGRWGWGVLDETPSPPCTAPTSYGRGRGSVARRRTIHASTASDGDLLNA